MFGFLRRTTSPTLGTTSLDHGLQMRPGKRPVRPGLIILVAAIVALAGAGCNPGNLIGWQPGWGAAAASDGVVYVGTRQGEVLALKANADGTLRPGEQLIWRYTPRENALGGSFGTPAVGEDMIYVGDKGDRDGKFGTIYALSKTRDSESSNLQANEWAKDLEGGIVGGPAIAEGLVLVASDDGKLYAFDAATGQRAGAFTTEGRIWSAPLIADGVAYFGSMDRYVYAVSLDRKLSQANLLWKFKTGGAVVGAPILMDGPEGPMVVVGSFDKKLYALKANTISSEGELVWAKPFAASDWLWAGPVTDGKLIFASAMDGNVYGLDPTGVPVWPFPFKAESPVVSTPVVIGDVLVVATDAGKLHILDTADGDELEVPRDMGGRVKAPLSKEGNMVFVGVEDSTVRGVDVKGWQERWQVSTKEFGER